MMSIRLKISILLCTLSCVCSAQTGKQDATRQEEVENFPPGPGDCLINVGDSIFISIYNCKNTGLLLFRPLKTTLQKAIAVVKENRPPLLTVHGNILYSFNYRSYIDTPFAQK